MNDKMELEEAVTRLTRDITKPLACGDICVVSISDVETVLQELKRYKRLAKANLKDSEEFKNNMCEHRCVLNSELQELQENSIPKKRIKNEIEILKAQCGGNPFHIQQTLNAEIRLLQELLEEN